jgi:shikimate kinase
MTGMRRVLITGMSGTGKSAVVRELVGRGYSAVDLDTADWSEWVDVEPADHLTPLEGKDWVWREDRVRALLSGQDQGLLFVSGCAQNMKRLFPLIETIVLLSAPISTIMDRLKARSSDGYGSTAEERQKVGELVATIEPLLRQSAHHEIDSGGPVATTVDALLQILRRDAGGTTDART